MSDELPMDGCESLADKLKKIISGSGATPVIDEELDDDLKNGTAAVIGKLVEVSNSSTDGEDMVVSQKIDENIKNKGVDVIGAELNRHGKTLVTVNTNEGQMPLKTHQGHFVSINKSNSFGLEAIGLIKAGLLMEILELKNSIITLCPKIAPVINTTFAVYYTMSDTELVNYRNMLRELLEANLLHESMIYFIEFLLNVCAMVGGVSSDSNLMPNLLASPLFRIVIKSWSTYWVHPRSIIGKTIIMTGTIQNAIGPTILQYIKSAIV